MKTIDKDYVDKLIASFLPEKKDALYDAVVYALFGSGKRIRPILLLKTAQAVSEIDDNCRRLAVALEFIHSYSLVHDDLPCMDDDDFRRGKASCHKQFGEAYAVLCGDALLNLAAETVFGGTMNDKYSEACKYLFKMSGTNGMIHGQVADIDGKSASFEDLYDVSVHKTSALLRAAVCCGAIAADVSPEHLAVLEKIAEKLGAAYQAADDLLDASSAEISFASVLGEEKCRDLCRRYADEICLLCDSLPYDLGFLKEMAASNVSRKF